MIEAFPGAGAPVVLRYLIERVGAVGQRRTMAEMTAGLVEALRGSDRVILVDEAETLTDQALLHLRRISDAAGVGVVLVGTPGLMGLVHDPDGKFGQITSRIGFWPPICQAISEDDAAALAAAYLHVSPEIKIMGALWESCQAARGRYAICCATPTDTAANKTRRSVRKSYTESINKQWAAGDWPHKQEANDEQKTGTTG